MVIKDHAVERRLPREARSVRRARGIVSELLVEDSGALLDTALLLVSELVGNAVRYGEEPITLDVRREDGKLVVGVSDASPRLPTLPEPSPAVQVRADPTETDFRLHEPVGGRGLRLIETLSHDWGVERRDGHKRVYFVLREP